MLLNPELLGLGLVLALIVLLPSRRLQLAGVSGRLVGLYAVFVWALAFILVIRPAAIRFLVPILVIAYIAPFIVAPERLSRLIQRGGPRPGRRGDGGPPRPPMKNVTPPDGPNTPP